MVSGVGGPGGSPLCALRSGGPGPGVRGRPRAWAWAAHRHLGFEPLGQSRHLPEPPCSCKWNGDTADVTASRCEPCAPGPVLSASKVQVMSSPPPHRWEAEGFQLVAELIFQTQPSSRASATCGRKMAPQSRRCPPHSWRVSSSPLCLPLAILLFAVTWHHDPRDLRPWHGVLWPPGPGQPGWGQSTVCAPWSGTRRVE